MAILFTNLKLYIPKLSCICWHAGIKKVEQIMQEEVVLETSCRLLKVMALS